MAKRVRVECAADLAAAAEQAMTVRVSRRDDLPPATGRVVAVGVRWFVLVDEGAIEVYRAFRLRDVAAVRTTQRASEHGGTSTLPEPTLPGVDPTSTGTLLTTAGEAFGMLTLHLERRTRVRSHTGRIAWLADKRVTLGAVDPATLERGRAHTIRYRAISRIDFGEVADAAPLDRFR